MALNRMHERDDAPGALNRKYASRYLDKAEGEKLVGRIFQKMDMPDSAKRSFTNASEARRISRGYSALAFIETAASKIGFTLKL